MSGLTDSAAILALYLRREHGRRMDAVGIADRIDALLDPSWYSVAQSCPALSGSTDLLDRARYAASCGGWEADLRAAMVSARDWLAAQGDPDGVEVADSALGAAVTMDEVLDSIPPSARDLWDSTPRWVKALAFGATFWVGLQVVREVRRD